MLPFASSSLTRSFMPVLFTSIFFQMPLSDLWQNAARRRAPEAFEPEALDELRFLRGRARTEAARRNRWKSNTSEASAATDTAPQPTAEDTFRKEWFSKGKAKKGGYWQSATMGRMRAVYLYMAAFVMNLSQKLRASWSQRALHVFSMFCNFLVECLRFCAMRCW